MSGFEMVGTRPRRTGPRSLGPWGPWTYNARNRTLTSSRARWYDVPLDDCTNSAHVLDWVAQLVGKSWVSPEDLGYFVTALDGLLGLQQHVCGCGVDKRIDPKAILAKGNR